MNFAAILAGGMGVRMGNPDKPKQFFMLGDKPVLIHTVEKFCAYGGFEKVVVLCPQTWIQQTKDCITKFCPHYESNIDVIAGGPKRNDTIMNAVLHIEKKYSPEEDAVIVTHDAVRPFVSFRIINSNIEAAQKYGACDTVVPATDTIVESHDGEIVSDIPERKNYYQGQTPQSFNLKKLKEQIASLTEQEKEILTDACKIFVLKNETVVLVEGATSNIKITFPEDIRIATSLLGEK